MFNKWFGLSNLFRSPHSLLRNIFLVNCHLLFYLLHEMWTSFHCIATPHYWTLTLIIFYFYVYSLEFHFAKTLLPKLFLAANFSPPSLLVFNIQKRKHPIYSIRLIFNRSADTLTRIMGFFVHDLKEISNILGKILRDLYFSFSCKKINSSLDLFLCICNLRWKNIDCVIIWY